MKSKKYTAKAFARDYQKLIKQIVKKLNNAKEAWEVDDQLQDLWDLADHGDVDALALYGLAFLKEGKGWYDPEEGRVALENAAEAGSAMAQYYLGRIQLEDEGKIAGDPIMARYWLKQAVDQGYSPAIELWEQKWGRNS